MIVKSLGAEVFVTVGSVDKKIYLVETYIIPEHRIVYTGVDVALNFLAGDALRATWECMAPLGRFVEIGKRDIKRDSGLENRIFYNSVTSASVALMIVTTKPPDIMNQVHKDVFDLCSLGQAAPTLASYMLLVS